MGNRPARAVATAVLAAVAGLGLGAVVTSTLLSPSRNDATTGDASTMSRTAPSHYPVNGHGQTYGSDLGAESFEDAPDLIEAYASNGRRGYIKKVDAFDPVPADPAAALRMQQALEGRARSVTVYASDGTTAVGVFVFSPLEFDDGSGGTR